LVAASGPLAKSSAAGGPVSDRRRTASNPRGLPASMNPAYTVSPLPSTITASGGTDTSGPTEAIRPSRTTTVAFGNTRPGSTTTFASRTA
jgi:hypothetical protein